MTKSSQGWVLVRKVDPKDLTAHLELEDAVDYRLLRMSRPDAESPGIRPWRECVAAMEEKKTTDGWPIPGPRTVYWCCKFIDRRQG